ncbi:MAG: hypothetical protein ACXWAC_06610 [Usitatibacter sp.]
MKLTLVLAAGVLGYCYYLGQSARKTKGAVKEDLRRWEGEGGNVPDQPPHSGPTIRSGRTHSSY